MSCLFCKIVDGSIPSTPVYQDEQCYSFADINPQAPVHVLVVPREHIVSLAEAGESHLALLGHMLHVAAEIARDKKLSKGYRVVFNTVRLHPSNTAWWKLMTDSKLSSVRRKILT